MLSRLQGLEETKVALLQSLELLETGREELATGLELTRAAASDQLAVPAARSGLEISSLRIQCENNDVVSSRLLQEKQEQLEQQQQQQEAAAAAAAAALAPCLGLACQTPSRACMTSLEL